MNTLRELRVRRAGWMMPVRCLLLGWALGSGQAADSNVRTSAPPARVRYARSYVRSRVQHHPPPPARAATNAAAVTAPVVVPMDPVALELAREEYQAALAAAKAAADARHQRALVGVDARVVAFLKAQTEAGSIYAPFDLAERYREGKGVSADPEEADRLVRLAAVRGNQDAARWLLEHLAK